MNDNLYLIRMHNTYGFINVNGQIVIDPIYKDAFDFSDYR